MESAKYDLEEIFNKFYFPNRENGNEDSSSEAHLKSSKTSRGPYLDLELSFFVKILEFLLFLFKGGGAFLYHLKVPSHQIRLGLKCYGWIGLDEYKDREW